MRGGDGWVCPGCGGWNAQAREACMSCSQPRPAGTPTLKFFQTVPACACGNPLMEGATTCSRCGTPVLPRSAPPRPKPRAALRDGTMPLPKPVNPAKLAIVSAMAIGLLGVFGLAMQNGGRVDLTGSGAGGTPYEILSVQETPKFVQVKVKVSTGTSQVRLELYARQIQGNYYRTGKGMINFYDGPANMDHLVATYQGTILHITRDQ